MKRAATNSWPLCMSWNAVVPAHAGTHRQEQFVLMYHGFLTPGLQGLYCSRSRTNRLQFRRGLLLWLRAVVCVASGSAPSCAVPPVRWGVLSPLCVTCLGGLRYAHQSLSSVSYTHLRAHETRHD